MIKRFLLKRIPVLKFDSSNFISEFYLEEENEEVLYVGQVIEGQRDYCKIINNETFASSQEEFINKSQNSDRLLTKIKLCTVIQGLSWEIHNFQFFNLIIADVQIPSQDYQLELPEEIKEVVIMEVTGLDNFNNCNLADSYEKVKI